MRIATACQAQGHGGAQSRVYTQHESRSLTVFIDKVASESTVKIAVFVICSGSVSVAAMEHLADDLSALFVVGAGFLDTLTIVRSIYVADDSGVFFDSSIS